MCGLYKGADYQPVFTVNVDEKEPKSKIRREMGEKKRETDCVQQKF